MKKEFALSLIIILLLSVVISPVTVKPTYAADNTKQIIEAIGIMKTDKGSNEDGTQLVTRARFAQMLVNASSLKSSVSGESSVSLFSDVKKNYWAAAYIQIAVAQGWMSGYLNGKFIPAQGISLQEAVYGVVKLLGYSSSDFSGSLTTGVMNLYKTKNLNKNISKTKTQYLTVDDCYNLFYNTLTATMKNGDIYAVTLGYSVDSYGELDYLSFVSSDVKGPIVVDEDWKNELPFSTVQATYYKDGEKSSLTEISDYDVLYYNEALKLVWIYDIKATGKIESVNPDYTSPKSVTVSGKSYTFADSQVSMRFSSMGDMKKGETVTLILDKDNVVIDVLSIDEYNVTITGVVIGTGTHLSETNGSYQNIDFITFVDAEGNTYQQDYDIQKVYFNYGDLARITFSNGVAEISKVVLDNISFGTNTFNSDGSMLGTTKLASNAKILDLYNSNYISISNERLAGVTLPSASVFYYELNASGEISEMIFNNITGDMDKYGIFTGFTAQANKMNYNYLIGSSSGSLQTGSLSSLSYEIGPKGFVFTNNELTKSYPLIGVDVTDFGLTTIQSGSTKFVLAEAYEVYLLVDGEYVVTTIDKINDLSKYNVKAYYDKLANLGGCIRIIVAESK